MFRHAQSHIFIICSYFLPGKIVRRLLKNAAKKGIKIKIIIAGTSDVSISKYAERWMYDWLLRNKMEIYEYQPTILHAKASVCDGQWLTLGSYNLNNLSAYASVELNVDVVNVGFAMEFEKALSRIMENDCKAITVEEHLKTKNILKQFIRWLSYQMIRMIFFLLTFYYKQER
jgi:cardiolipin synthase